MRCVEVVKGRKENIEIQLKLLKKKEESFLQIQLFSPHVLERYGLIMSHDDILSEGEPFSFFRKPVQDTYTLFSKHIQDLKLIPNGGLLLEVQTQLQGFSRRTMYRLQLEREEIDELALMRMNMESFYREFKEAISRKDQEIAQIQTENRAIKLEIMAHKDSQQLAAACLGLGREQEAIRVKYDRQFAIVETEIYKTHERINLHQKSLLHLTVISEKNAKEPTKIGQFNQIAQNSLILGKMPQTKKQIIVEPLKNHKIEKFNDEEVKKIQAAGKQTAVIQQPFPYKQQRKFLSVKNPQSFSFSSNFTNANSSSSNIFDKDSSNIFQRNPLLPSTQQKSEENMLFKACSASDLSQQNLRLQFQNSGQSRLTALQVGKTHEIKMKEEKASSRSYNALGISFLHFFLNTSIQEELKSSIYYVMDNGFVYMFGTSIEGGPVVTEDKHLKCVVDLEEWKIEWLIGKNKVVSVPIPEQKRNQKIYPFAKKISLEPKTK